MVKVNSPALFDQAKDTVRQWFMVQQTGCLANAATEIIGDTSTCFRAMIKTANRLSELMVANESFSPYRWVSFQVLDMRARSCEKPLFCYFDTPQDSLEHILAQLEYGLTFLTEETQ